MNMGTISIRRHARRAAFVLAAAVCVCAIGAGTAQAQPPLAWANPVPTDSSGHITALSCQSAPALLCVAVDDAGKVLSSTAPASGTWSSPAAIDTSASPHLTAISCPPDPSTALCFAVDETGNNLYASQTPASAPWTAGTIDSGHQLNGISCPSTSLCVAVDNSGNVLWSATPGTAGSWIILTPTVDPGNHIAAVSCPTASLCVATDNVGNVLVSTNPTSMSSWQTTLLTDGANPLTAVSCNVTALCVAVASNGSVYATANAASSGTWSTSIELPGLSAVSCTNAGLCVLVGGNGSALESDNPTASRPAWALASIDPGHALTAVSCLSTGICVAVDNVGDAVAATLPAPTVATATGTSSSQTTASLAATVNPNDATLTDCHFDYGSTSAYGSSVPCPVGPSATGGSQTVTAALSGLNAATTYHFRIVASSAVAVADGSDATFTTPALLKPSPSISGIPAVGSTLTCKSNVTTTAADTVGYQWLSDTAPIAGATMATYVIAVTDQTHHVSCQVTISGDGGSASAISGYDGVPSQSAGKITESFVGTDKRGASSVSAPVTCSPQAPAGCTIKLLLTATKTVKHRSQQVTVGSSTAKLGVGARRTLSVSLNATGQRMLKKQHTLGVTFTVSGTVVGRLTANLQSAKLVFTQKSKKHGKRHATRNAR
jgi:hypothetical protein